jgi:ABC-2 type transport system ATP-binding protein
MHPIEIEGLSKSFGDIEAVCGVSFTVARGEVLGFLGPNGAGKSTTMKMLAGFLTPTAGTARICGHDVVTDGLAARARLGYLPEGAPAYPDMTPADFLAFIARVRGFRGSDAKSAIDQAVRRVELGAVLHQPIETLSKGFRRRVGLAQALLHDPDVLILDEPTDGLDPNQKHQVRQLIASMAATKAIIISTHILEEVDAVCTRAMVIAGGRVKVDGTPAELEARSPYYHAVYVRGLAALPDNVHNDLAALPSVSSVAPSGRADDTGIYVLPEHGADIAGAVRDTLARHNVPLAELRIERGRLDDVFRDITRAAA